MNQLKVWYLAKDGRQTGPFTEDEVKQLIEEGSVDSEFFVFKTGTEEWAPISEAQEFVRLITVPPLPPPPPPATKSKRPNVSTDEVQPKPSQKPISQPTPTRKKRSKGFRHFIGGLVLGGIAFAAAYIATNDQALAVGGGVIGFILFLLVVGSKLAWVSTFVAVAGLGFRYLDHEPDRFCFGVKDIQGRIDARLPYKCYQTFEGCGNENRAAIAAHRDQYACRPICNPNSKMDCFIEELRRDFISLNRRYFSD